MVDVGTSHLAVREEFRKMEINLTHAIVAFVFLLIVFFAWSQRSVIKQVYALSNALQGIAISNQNNKQKRSFRKSLKLVSKTFRSLVKQKPENFKDNSQLGSFNLILKNQDGKFDILKADGVIGEEMIAALEDLGIETIIEKFT